jgi:hypothetical protein
MWDKLGGSISFLCLIHCLMWPWLAILTPLLMLTEDSTHRWLFIILVPAAIMAGINAYMVHRQHKPWILLMIGLVLIGLPIFMHMDESKETVTTVAGSLLLIAGHLLNRKLFTMKKFVMGNLSA